MVRLAFDPASRTYTGRASFGPATRVADSGALLSWLDDELTIGAQERRPDLLFLHAAAVARRSRALLLLADSGGGKSTATWAAVHEGFTLLSDELAPVRPADATVFPHPRAVCLKTLPPGPWPLPEGTLRSSGGYHVPPDLLPLPPADLPTSIGALVFVGYRPELPEPALLPIGPAEAAARLYAHSLNPLAHGSDGLDAVASLAELCPAFVLHSGELRATARLLTALCEHPAQAEEAAAARGPDVR